MSIIASQPKQHGLLEKKMLSYMCVSVFWFLGALHATMMVYSHEVPYLTHQGEFIANHSYVNTSLLGQTNGVYVRCHSDVNVCCHPNQGRWFYPNGSLLKSLQSSYNVYTLPDGQQVALRRRNDPVVPAPEGLYRCEVQTYTSTPDVEKGYVGLYFTGG